MIIYMLLGSNLPQNNKFCNRISGSGASTRQLLLIRSFNKTATDIFYKFLFKLIYIYVDGNTKKLSQQYLLNLIVVNIFKISFSVIYFYNFQFSETICPPGKWHIWVYN